MRKTSKISASSQRAVIALIRSKVELQRQLDDTEESLGFYAKEQADLRQRIEAIDVATSAFPEDLVAECVKKLGASRSRQKARRVVPKNPTQRQREMLRRVVAALGTADNGKWWSVADIKSCLGISAKVHQGLLSALKYGREMDDSPLEFRSAPNQSGNAIWQYRLKPTGSSRG